MNAARWTSVLLLVLAAIATAGWQLQRWAGAELRAEIDWQREENRELARLQAESQRLATKQPSPAELAALRADHAAVARLQHEIETLRDTVQRRERALGGRGR